MKVESNTITRVQAEHIGTRVLVKLGNQGMPIERTIEEISPGGEYIRVGRAWVENKPGSILCILSQPAKRRRIAI